MDQEQQMQIQNVSVSKGYDNTITASIFKVMNGIYSNNREFGVTITPKV